MRKTKDVTIGPEGERDAGKTFLITEADAFRTEKWAFRALFIAAQSGANVGDLGAGLAGVARMGLSTVLNARFADVEPLLDEMMTTVQIKPGATSPNVDLRTVARPLTTDDIEEVKTLFRLRREVMTLHLGFSFADALSTWGSAASNPSGSGNTQTSPAP